MPRSQLLPTQLGVIFSFSLAADNMARREDLAVPISIVEWARCLRDVPGVARVAPMVDSSGQSRKSAVPDDVVARGGGHYAQFELKVFSEGCGSKYLTSGVSMHGGVLHVYMRQPPRALIQDAPRIFDDAVRNLPAGAIAATAPPPPPPATSLSSTLPPPPPLMEGEGEWEYVQHTRYFVPLTCVPWFAADGDENSGFIVDDAKLQSLCGTWKRYLSREGSSWWCKESDHKFFLEKN